MTAPASNLTQHTRRHPSVAGAAAALALLTALNFVNYIDRYILPGVQEQVKLEFHVSDAALARSPSGSSSPTCAPRR